MVSIRKKRNILEGLVFFFVVMLVNPVFSQVIDEPNLQGFTLQGDPSEPHLVDVEPNQGLQGTYLEVTITAQGTSFSQGSGTVWFTQGSSTAIYPLQYSASDNETITGFFNLGDSPTGLYNVNTSSAEGHLVLPNSFEVLFNPNMPEIVSVDPNTAEQGQSLSVSITGANTHFGQGTSTTQVWFTQASGTTIYPANVHVNSETDIAADFEFGYGSNYPPGFYDVWVINSIDNALVKNSGFLLQQGSNLPEISSVTPDGACKESQVQLTVSGNNLNFQEAASNNLNVWLQISNTNYYQIYPTDIQVINDNQLVANFDIGNWVDAWFYDLMLYSEYTGYLVYPDAVFINSEPEILPTPIGVSSLCSNPPNVSYNPPDGGNYNSNEFLWVLEPEDAGSIIGNGFQIEIDWENSYTGLAYLSVAGENDCGIGLYSNPLEISIADNPTIAGFTFSNYGGMIQFNNTSQYADDFYWEFGDGETSTEAFPMHAYNEDGYYTVILYASGGSCGSDTYSEEIYINHTTITENSTDLINLYPNPVTSVLFFNKNVNTVEVFNINGQKILEESNTSNLNFDAISAGVYIVKIRNANQIITRRVIKQ